MAWTPEGRRLVTGASSGEFTLWNGLTFNFETILQVMWGVEGGFAGFCEWCCWEAVSKLCCRMLKWWLKVEGGCFGLQAHDSPVRTMVWSHNDSWMVTGDHAGYVKYWQSNMNNVKMFQAHKEALRGIRYLQLHSVIISIVYSLCFILINGTFLLLLLNKERRRSHERLNK